MYASFHRSNNPFAPTSSTSPQPSLNNNRPQPSFNLGGTYDSHSPSNLSNLSSPPGGGGPRTTPSPQPGGGGQGRVNVKTKTELNANEAHLASLFANRDDGQDTFGNIGALRYVVTFLHFMEVGGFWICFFLSRVYVLSTLQTYSNSVIFLRSGTDKRKPEDRFWLNVRVLRARIIRLRDNNSRVMINRSSIFRP